MRRLIPLPVPAGPGVRDVLPALSAALDGSGPAVLPYAAGGAPPPRPPYDERELPGDLAVVIGTSGSTGTPKLALLTAGALAASAAATARRLGGPGDWLLALSAHHIAGLQVLLRAASGGGHVEVLAPGPFTAAGFAEATAALASGRGVRGRRAASRPAYVSVVPTQLGRILADPAGRAALATYDAVLVGGAACPPELLDRAREGGAHVRTTYGSSETCGGCVYDGAPLSGVDVEVEAPDADGRGRVLLAGPMLASGYLGNAERAAEAFPTVDGRRRYRTDDLGSVDAAGRLTVWGRADDVIVSGGLKILPALVAAAAERALPGWEALVVGVPDAEWGHVVGLAIAPRGDPDPTRPSPAGVRALADAGASADVQVPAGGPAPLRGPAPSLTDVRTALRGALPDHALPRRLLVLPELPLLGVGKPDRAAVRTAFGART